MCCRQRNKRDWRKISRILCCMQLSCLDKHEIAQEITPECHGSRWFPGRTLPVAPLWCDLGFVLNSRGNKAAANLRPVMREMKLLKESFQRVKRDMSSLKESNSTLIAGLNLPTANFDPEIAGSCGFSEQPPGMKKNSMRRKEKMNYLMIIWYQITSIWIILMIIWYQMIIQQLSNNQLNNQSNDQLKMIK